MSILILSIFLVFSARRRHISVVGPFFVHTRKLFPLSFSSNEMKSHLRQAEAWTISLKMWRRMLGSQRSSERDTALAHIGNGLAGLIRYCTQHYRKALQCHRGGTWICLGLRAGSRTVVAERREETPAPRCFSEGGLQLESICA